MWLADPELVSARVVSIGQTNMNISWSTGSTDVINDTFIKYKEVLQISWITVQPTSPGSHVISPLLPGHTYEIYVVIHSFDKTVMSDILENSTGEPFLSVKKKAQ